MWCGWVGKKVNSRGGGHLIEPKWPVPTTSQTILLACVAHECAHTTQYSQQLEKEKHEAPDEEEAWKLAPEKLMTILAKVGVQATAEQVTGFARQIEETAAKRRKCG